MYFCLLNVCVKQVLNGLSKGLSMRLARATVSGAGELMHNSDLEPAMLRQNVTSPGGTTAEALKILMGQNGWQNIITRALKAAKKNRPNWPTKHLYLKLFRQNIALN